MGRELFGLLPDPLDRVVLRRVWRQTEEFDAATVLGEPCLAHVIESVAWPVVDDQEDFPAAAADDGF